MSSKRNQMNRRRFMSNFAFASTALATGAGSWVLRPEWANAAADPIKVGIATDLTGPIGYAGNADANVAKMVIKEINDEVSDALSDLDDSVAEVDDERKAEIENKREAIRDKMRQATLTAKRREALQEKLDAIEDYDADEHDAEREEAKKATIKETIKQCCSNF